MAKLFSSTLFFTIILATIFSLTVVHFLQYLDLNKRVYNHVPGECSTIQSIQSGAPDMVFFENNIFFPSGSDINNSTNATEAGIYIYRPESRELLKIELSSFNEKKQFNPHGLSIFMNVVFVTNSLYPEKSHDRVDIFNFVFKKNKFEPPKLKFQKSITSEVMTGIRGITAVGKNRFYLTNKYYFRKPGLRKFEVIMKLNTGTIMYFDGKKIQIAATNLPTPTGMAYDGRKRQLYVTCFSVNSVFVYNANLASLTKVNVGRDNRGFLKSRLTEWNQHVRAPDYGFHVTWF